MLVKDVSDDDQQIHLRSPSFMINSFQYQKKNSRVIEGRERQLKRYQANLQSNFSSTQRRVLKHQE